MFYFYDCSTGLELLHYHSCLFPLLLGLRLLPRVRPAHKDGRRTAPQHILMPTCYIVFTGLGRLYVLVEGELLPHSSEWKSGKASPRLRHTTKTHFDRRNETERAPTDGRPMTTTTTEKGNGCRAMVGRVLIGCYRLGWALSGLVGEGNFSLRFFFRV